MPLHGLNPRGVSASQGMLPSYLGAARLHRTGGGLVLNGGWCC